VPNIIHTAGLVRCFGTVCAVDDISLDVPTGIIFGLLGPNGSGKTTIIRLLLGLLEPTSGTAEVLGLDTRSQADKIREQTGALLEHSGLYERLSAEDNLEFYGRVWRMPAPERASRARELLTHLGLWERRKEPTGKWSRGMKQKLAMARAIFHRPPLVLLDEPTAGLDPVAAAALRNDLDDMVAREGITVFLTTHNLAEAERHCSRVAVIRQGKLLALGHPDELRAQAGGSQVEVIGRGFNEDLVVQLSRRPEVTGARIQNGRLIVDLKDNAEAAPLVAALVCAGVRVEEVRKSTVSLEEAFLALVEEDHGH